MTTDTERPQDRTEEEIVSVATVRVMLGGSAYELKPKVINEAARWREKMLNRVAPLFAALDVKPDDPESFSIALQALLINFPDLICELICDWSEGIEKNLEKIKEEATDQEMVTVFTAVLSLAYPFSFVVATMGQLLKSAPATARSMSSS